MKRSLCIAGVIVAKGKKIFLARFDLLLSPLYSEEIQINSKNYDKTACRDQNQFSRL